MILETIFSTLDPDGRPNFAPMGVVWGEDRLTVRPFRSTRTFRNLEANGAAVVSLTDNVLAFVQCGLYHAQLPHFPSQVVQGAVFQGACAWREVEVEAIGGSTERAEVACRVVHRGRQRDFLGLCRAQAAVLEAAILATRLHLTDRQSARQALEGYAAIVEKTGGETERTAIQLVRDYFTERKQDDSRDPDRD